MRWNNWEQVNGEGFECSISSKVATGLAKNLCPLDPRLYTTLSTNKCNLHIPTALADDTGLWTISVKQTYTGSDTSIDKQPRTTLIEQQLYIFQETFSHLETRSILPMLGPGYVPKVVGPVYNVTFNREPGRYETHDVRCVAEYGIPTPKIR